MRGISVTQGAQEVAQKLTSVTLPRRSALAMSSPDKVANFTSGIAAGRPKAKASPMANTASARLIRLILIRLVMIKKLRGNYAKPRSHNFNSGRCRFYQVCPAPPPAALAARRRRANPAQRVGLGAFLGRHQQPGRRRR